MKCQLFTYLLFKTQLCHLLVGTRARVCVYVLGNTLGKILEEEIPSFERYSKISYKF